MLAKFAHPESSPRSNASSGASRALKRSARVRLLSIGRSEATSQKYGVFPCTGLCTTGSHAIANQTPPSTVYSSLEGTSLTALYVAPGVRTSSTIMRLRDPMHPLRSLKTYVSDVDWLLPTRYRSSPIPSFHRLRAEVLRMVMVRAQPTTNSPNSVNGSDSAIGVESTNRPAGTTEVQRRRIVHQPKRMHIVNGTMFTSSWKP